MIPAGRSQDAKRSSYSPPKTTGEIDNPEITESSGVAASKCQADVFWTHNDSGDDAYLYAINRKGGRLGTWKVPNAENTDWEDIASHKDAAGKCFIYIGEIGDNERKRPEHKVYRVAEPTVLPENADSTKKQPLETAPAESLKFRYPDANQDAETLMVDPSSADIYVVTKKISGPAGVYRLKSDFGNPDTANAEKIADVSMPAVPNGYVTGGDISPDGRRVIICDYSAAYEFTLPAGAKSLDDIWKQTPESVDVGKRKTGEAVCYTQDGNSLILTTEGKNKPVIEVVRKP